MVTARLYWRVKFNRWWEHHTRVMAFRWNDEFIYNLDAEVDWEKKILRVKAPNSPYGDIVYKIYGRDYARCQFLLY